MGRVHSLSVHTFKYVLIFLIILAAPTEMSPARLMCVNMLFHSLRFILGREPL